MEEIIRALQQNMSVFLLLFFRITALVVLSPVFGRKNIPNPVKVGLCLIITYVVFSGQAAMPSLQANNLLVYTFLCIKELVFGLVLGYVTTVFFSVVQTAGQVIDMQMGFGMVNVMDVQSNISVPVTGNLLNILLLVTFFSVNGHLQLMHILIATFNMVPVGQVALNPTLAWSAVEIFVLSFMLVANVAMPMIASGLLGELLMGVMVRTVPQVNMFVIGIPLKIFLGFLMLLLVLPFYVSFTNTLFQKMFLSLENMFQALAGVT